MNKLPLPQNEKERLEALINYSILESMPDSELENLTQLAAFICQTPIALISIADGNKQWYKSKIGLSIYENPKEIDFCEDLLVSSDYKEVPDALLDPNYNKSPLVIGSPGFRFFAGVPLTSREGFNIGSLVVIDVVVRSLNKEQKNALKMLGRQVISHIELIKGNKNLQAEVNQLVHEKVNQTEIDLASYKFALDHSANVVITDPRGIIKFVNERFCNSSQYSKEELIGQSISILNSGYHPAEFMEGLWFTIQGGKVWRGEICNKARNGDFYWDEVSIIPFLDKRGRPYQYVSIVQDITEKKSARERLLLETKLITILGENKNIDQTIQQISLDICESMDWQVSVFWEFDDQKSVLYNPLVCNYGGEKLNEFCELNKEFSFHRGEALPGIAWEKKEPLWVSDLAAEEQFRRFAPAIEAGLKAALVFPVMFNNEVIGIMEFFSTNVIKRDMNLIEMFDGFSLQVGAFIERKRAEEELLKAKKQAEESVISKDQFLANMSHEIRTPMNAIIGFTELLSQSGLDTNQEELAASVKVAGENLLSIINDILDFSKIESGVIIIDSQPNSIRTILANVYNLLKISAENKGLELRFDIDHRIPALVLCDAVRLNQVLVNLVGNAIKFTERGSVKVHVRQVDSSATHCELNFSIRDTGIGIPDEKREEIFERFSQVNNEINRKYEGTGLGLSISKNLIELMGGELLLQSMLGEGSEFSFSLRFEIAADEIISNIQSTPDSIYMDISPRVLLIEDNQLNQKLARNVLTNLGFEVEIADQGLAGLELLKQGEFDLVLMDIQMPGLDGYQTTSIIRNELKLNVPIIAMTAHSIVGEKEKCLSVGMNDFISKPFNQLELFQKMYRLLAPGKKLSPQKEMGAKHSNPRKLQLEYLHELSEGNAAFEIDMMETFMNQVPADMRLLQEAFEQSEYLRISEIAHKLKSSVGIFGMADLEKILSELSVEARKKRMIPVMKKQFETVKRGLEDMYPLLQDALKQLTTT